MSKLSVALRKATGKVLRGAGYVPYSFRNERHQIEFRKNRESIARGDIPARYQRTAELVPGSRVIDIGSADGTLALVLAQIKDFVIGAELMLYRHKTAQEMKATWAARGAKTDNLRFINRGARRLGKALDQVDTVVMSRTLYHLRDDAEWLFDQIQAKSNIKNVALFGNRDKEQEWFDTKGEKPGLGKHLALAGQEGMEDILTRHGFTVTVSIPSTDSEDPVVIGTR